MIRLEGVPEVLTEWIDRWGGCALRAAPEDLVDAGCRALGAAVVLPPEDRRSAHALLAADALLTAAVGRLAESDRPEDALGALIERVASEPAETGDDV